MKRDYSNEIVGVLIVLIIVLTSVLSCVLGQSITPLMPSTSVTLRTMDYFVERDTLCEQRGHVKTDVIYYEDEACTTFLIENHTYTVKVTEWCRYMSYQCLRCGEIIQKTMPATYDTIWRKQ